MDSKDFLSRIDRVSAAPCWTWAGRMCGRGYGRFDASLYGQRHIKAHRYSWAYYNGRPIPEGLVICHSCDNPRCVNPDHLRADTQASNNLEAIAKGRWKPNVGARNGRTVLTPQQVLEIRQSQDTQMALATRYGISQTHISRVIRGESWAV